MVEVQKISIELGHTKSIELGSRGGTRGSSKDRTCVLGHINLPKGLLTF